MSTPFSHHQLVSQLCDLGVRPGDVLIVHTAFSRVGPVEGGPRGLIAALQDAIAPGGTLVMPSMSDDDEHPFDRERTPCAGMGVVANTFWTLPGVLRSDSPHAFAASGPRAAAITADHPVDLPHGPNSPVGRVRDLDGKVLLLGIGHDADTMVHLAEYLAGVRYRIPKYAMVRAGAGTARVDYGEIDHCCANFDLLDAWLDAEQLQRRGTVGRGDARLSRSCDIIDVAVRRLHENETAFLHPPGVDAECDEARASIPPSAR